MDKIVYQKEDGKWYVFLYEKDYPNFGEQGPYDTKKEALDKWFEYCRYLEALDAG